MPADMNWSSAIYNYVRICEITVTSTEVTCAVASWQATRCKREVVRRIYEAKHTSTHVGTELEVAGAANNLLVDGIVKMAVENFLGEGERTVKSELAVSSVRDLNWSNSPLTDDNEVVLDALVIDECALLEKRHGDFGVADAGCSCGHALSEALEGGDSMRCLAGDGEHRANNDEERAGWCWRTRSKPE